MERVALLEIFSKCNLFDERLTREMVSAAVVSVVEGGFQLSGFGITVEGSHTGGGVTYVQFLGLLRWIAEKKNLTYSECASRITNSSVVLGKGSMSMRKRLHALWTSALGDRNRMTPYDFMRLLQKQNKYVAERFTSGDVYLMFIKCGEKSTIGFECFERLLQKVADKLEIGHHELVAILTSTEKVTGPPEALKPKPPPTAAKAGDGAAGQEHGSRQLERSAGRRISEWLCPTSPSNKNKSEGDAVGKQKSLRRFSAAMGATTWDYESDGLEDED